MTKERLDLKVGGILDDIDLLRNRHIQELDKTPGKPKCATLADRMEENLNAVVDAYEEMIADKNLCADRAHFYLLSGMLDQLASETAILSKKQPDALVNAFKVEKINRVLRPLKELMKDEPSNEFLDLISEPEEGSEARKSRNTYSDVALVLSQFKEACDRYKMKYEQKGKSKFVQIMQ